MSKTCEKNNFDYAFFMQRGLVKQVRAGKSQGYCKSTRGLIFPKPLMSTPPLIVWTSVQTIISDLFCCFFGAILESREAATVLQFKGASPEESIASCLVWLAVSPHCEVPMGVIPTTIKMFPDSTFLWIDLPTHLLQQTKARLLDVKTRMSQGLLAVVGILALSLADTSSNYTFTSR